MNNAGAFEASLCDDFVSLENYKAIMDVNIYGVIRVTQAFKALVKKSKYKILLKYIRTSGS